MAVFSDVGDQSSAIMDQSYVVLAISHKPQLIGISTYVSVI